MRHLRWVAAVVLLAGCGQPRPATSHGKPVAYWVQALQDPSVKVRKKAVQALGFVGPADPAALPALTQALRDGDAGVRAEAVLALLNLGAAARDALSALEEARNDRNAAVRAYAAKAVEKVRGG
jgi:HEAT repeat protein